MKKTIGGILGIGGFLLFVGGIVCLGLELEGPIGMVLLVLGLVACIVGFALIIQPNPEDAKRMEELIDDAGLVVCEGAGHYSFLEQPAKVHGALKAFFG